MNRAAVKFLLIAALACAGTSAAYASENRLNTLMGREIGATACFTRSYTPEFLAKHPRQRIAEVTASIFVGKGGPEEGRWFWIGLREKGKTGMVYGSGGCDWRDDVNRTVDGRPILPNFTKRTAGAGCLMSVGLEHSDEHNGPDDTVLDIAADGKSITVYTDSFTPVLTGSPGRWKRVRKTLGPEDRVFRLERTEAALCMPMNGATDTLE